MKKKYTIDELLKRVRELKVPIKYRRILREKVKFLGDELDDESLKKIIGEFEENKSNIEIFINTIRRPKKIKRNNKSTKSETKKYETKKSKRKTSK